MRLLLLMSFFIIGIGLSSCISYDGGPCNGEGTDVDSSKIPYHSIDQIKCLIRDESADKHKLDMQFFNVMQVFAGVTQIEPARLTELRIKLNSDGWSFLIYRSRNRGPDEIIRTDETTINGITYYNT